MKNMPKRELYLFMLHEFKFGHNASKILPISKEYGVKDPHVIGQYECGSKNYVVEMRALKMKKIEDEHAVLTTNNCKQFLSKFLSKRERNVLDTWRHYCNSFTSFKEH